MNIDAKLNNARTLLNELGNSIANLVNSSPDVFADPGIKSALDGFLDAFEEAVERLENPSFRIATIGTTSSGKSTIVNALIGRKIAPIDAEEMSGGVLTLKHSQDSKLIIEKTQNAAWETGEWTGLTDDDLYQRIRSVMNSYHEARQKREYVAPQITAYVPLLPACDSNLLGLPPGIGVELIDLPGLKSVQDRTNLATIQQQVNKTFSLVALDYTQVDDSHRKRLLEELKKVVEYLQGRTDSMIFILNRVDRRTENDLPLKVRINKLRAEIKEVLSLPELPDVLPFNALLLYYAQCAWGAGALNEPSTVDQKTRLELLKYMFKNCANTLGEHTENNWDLEDWFRDIKRQVSRGISINDETMLKILIYALEWSGGKELWQLFKERVEKSFTELVIFPAVISLHKQYNDLSEKLNTLIITRKLESKEEIEQEKANVQKISQNLQSYTKKAINEFSNEISTLIKELQNLQKNNKVNTYKYIRDTNLQKFQKIIESVNEIEKDLISSLIFPIIDALKNNHGSYDLQDKLNEVINPQLARHIAEVYDKLSRELLTGGFDKQPGYLIKKVRLDNKKDVQELDHIERRVRLIYATVRNAIEARSQFLMQSKGQYFISVLDNFIETSFKHQSLTFVNTVLSVMNLDEAIINNFIKKLPPTSPNLPDEFFNIPLNVQIYEGTDKDGSCGSKADKYNDKKYKYLKIPDIDAMGKQWSDGIAKAKNNLWDIFHDWMIKQLNSASNVFSESVNEISDFAERILNEQFSIIQEEIEKQERWRKFEIEKDSIAEIFKNLQSIYGENNHV
nr:dynamin family protein [Dolichospermum sp. UHCC 0259]